MRVRRRIITPPCELEPSSRREITAFDGDETPTESDSADELYAQTVSGHGVVHFTYSPDTGAFHFHEDVHARS
jgi:hypothetical protein